MNQTTGKTSQHAMWSVLDRELSDRSKDAFGHQHYADLLELCPKVGDGDIRRRV